MADYRELMELWETVGLSELEHECSEQEFYRCEICEAANQAWHRLEHSTRDLLELLEGHHAALEQLVEAVLQNAPGETMAKLDSALAKAVAVLNQGCE